MHVTCDKLYIIKELYLYYYLYILLKVKIIRSKVKITEVMAAAGALCHANTSCYYLINVNQMKDTVVIVTSVAQS